MIRKSISAKLSISFILILIVSMLTIGAIFIQVFKSYAFENKGKSMESRAKDISEVTSQYLSDEPNMRGYGSFLKLLDKLVGARIWILDKEGKIIIVSGSTEQGSLPTALPKPSQQAISLVLSGLDWKGESFSQVYDEPMLTIGVPVFDMYKKTVGAIFMHAPVTGINEGIDKAVSILLIGIMISTILSGILIVIYSKSISKPLKLLNKLALEIADGNYSVRTNIRQSDEIGQLSYSFDLMANKLNYTIEELFSEKGKLDDIILSISDGLIVLDDKSKIMRNNSKALEILGCESLESVVRMTRSDDRFAGYRDSVKTALEKGDSSQIKIEINHRFIKSITSPVMNSNNSIIGVVTLLHDISEAEQLDRLRRDFISNASHELRTPLTVIRGAIEAITDGTITDGSEIQEYQEKIRMESKVLENLVIDLLDLSKLESNKIELIKKQTDMVSLAKDTIKSVEKLGFAKGISISLNILGEPYPVEVDYFRIRQVLVIFLDNGIKYSPKNSNMEVTVDFGEKLRISISDSGIGISKFDLPYVWDRFYMVDKSHGNLQKSAGLGLSIAKSIIEKHGGEAFITSSLNEGTVVGFEISKYI